MIAFLKMLRAVAFFAKNVVSAFRRFMASLAAAACFAANTGSAICLMKNLREILALQTLHLSIEKPILDGRRASAIQAALRRRRAGDAWLGQGSKVTDAIKQDAVVYPSWNNTPH
jgi:hypothetical protein